MDGFRSYGVRLTGVGAEASWRFAERTGALFSVDETPAAPVLVSWPMEFEGIGARLELTIYGNPGDRRTVPAQTDPARRLLRLFDALAHFRAGVVVGGLERISFLKYAEELEASVLRDALAPDERMNLLAEAVLGAWHPVSDV